MNFDHFLLLLLAAAAAVLISTLIAGGGTILSFPAFGSEEKDAVIPIPIPGAVGPESLAFDSLGSGPYAGVSDGRIIKWEEKQGRWIDFATTASTRFVRSVLSLS